MASQEKLAEVREKQTEVLNWTYLHRDGDGSFLCPLCYCQRALAFAELLAAGYADLVVVTPAYLEGAAAGPPSKPIGSVAAGPLCYSDQTRCSSRPVDSLTGGSPD